MLLPNLWKSISSSLEKYFSNKNVFMLHKPNPIYKPTSIYNKPTSINNNPTPKTDYGDRKPIKGFYFWLARLYLMNPLGNRFVRIPYSNKFCFVLSERAETFMGKLMGNTVDDFGLKFFPPLSWQAKLAESVAKKMLDAMSEGLMLEKGYKINGKMKTCLKNKQDMRQRELIWKPEIKHLNGKEWQIHVAEKLDEVGMSIAGGLIVVTTPFKDDEPANGKELVVANILAHELGHQVAKHVSRRSVLLQFGCAVSLCCTSGLDLVDFIDLFPVMYPLLDLWLAYISRRHETEADYIGMMLMASAGYHPGWVPAFYELPALQLKDGLFCTHYSGKKRAKLLNRDKVMKEALKVYEDVKAGKRVKSFV